MALRKTKSESATVGNFTLITSPNLLWISASEDSGESWISVRGMILPLDIVQSSSSSSPSDTNSNSNALKSSFLTFFLCPRSFAVLEACKRLALTSLFAMLKTLGFHLNLNFQGRMSDSQQFLCLQSFSEALKLLRGRTITLQDMSVHMSRQKLG